MDDLTSLFEKLHQQLHHANYLMQIDRIILFGSRARGDSDPRSDIDLAIDAPELNTADWFKVKDIIDNLPTLLSFDIVNYQQSTETLKNVIDQQGKIIYARKQT